MKVIKINIISGHLKSSCAPTLLNIIGSHLKSSLCSDYLI